MRGLVGGLVGGVSRMSILCPDIAHTLIQLSFLTPLGAVFLSSLKCQLFADLELFLCVAWFFFPSHGKGLSFGPGLPSVVIVLTGGLGSGSVWFCSICPFAHICPSSVHPSKKCIFGFLLSLGHWLGIATIAVTQTRALVSWSLCFCERLKLRESDGR